MTGNGLIRGESYEGWIGHDEDADGVWHTVDGESFAITERAVYLPQGIEPVEGDHRVPVDRISSYEVRKEFHNELRKTSSVIGGGGVIILFAVLLGQGIGVLLGALGLLLILAGGVMALKDRHNEGETHVEVTVNNRTTTVELEDIVGDEVEDALSRRVALH
jgi:hypothetical protein